MRRSSVTTSRRSIATSKPRNRRAVAGLSRCLPGGPSRRWQMGQVHEHPTFLAAPAAEADRGRHRVWWRGAEVGWEKMFERLTTRPEQNKYAASLLVSSRGTILAVLSG